MTGALPNLQYSRNATRVMAYMIPLPQPLRNGVLQDVPQRYMLYMPPAPDLLKPTETGTKERKRDKAVRRWQQEVRKAKTFNGKVVSLGGIQSMSIRGAVWVLSVIKPSDVTFLSRVPRKSVKSLILIHPEGPARQSTDDMFHNVKGELSRTKSRTKRDFWIGTALLPITFTIDLIIPVFGGLSEVNMVWMAVNASAWMTANKVITKLRPAQGGFPDHQDPNGAMMLRRSYTVDGSTGAGQARDGSGEHNTGEKGEAKDKEKDKDKTIQMVFQPSPAMDLMKRYVEEACHKCNSDAFPSSGGYVPGEAEVLASMGWTPEHREVPDAENDVAWQIRKVTEDLREATNRAAKSWDSWCKKYTKNPKKATDEKNLDSDDSEEEEWKPDLPKRPPVQYR
ncbi:putative secreted [Diaporthe ampelina]|uniref:Putative secreted n=1 Tax=Diaporthe ampelina TaxID=1214573 RepID=A0A0G2FCY7_9PEZI|nr:putative secreted [Diaporthe ampelina]